MADLVGQTIGPVHVQTADQISDLQITRTDHANHQLRHLITAAVRDPTGKQHRVRRLGAGPDAAPGSRRLWGQPVRVGAFTVTLHNRQWIDFLEASDGELAATEIKQRLLVDVSLRNSSGSSLPWPTQVAFTVLARNGTGLNAEYGDLVGMAGGAFGLLREELRTNACRDKIGAILQGVDHAMQLLPEVVHHGWLSYKQMAGLAHDGLQLKVKLLGPELRPTIYRAVFALDRTPPAPAPWTGMPSPPADQVSVGTLNVSSARIGPVDPSDVPGQPALCSFMCRVTFDVENTGAETVTVQAPKVVDADGHSYVTTFVE